MLTIKNLKLSETIHYYLLQKQQEMTMTTHELYPKDSIMEEMMVEKDMRCPVMSVYRVTFNGQYSLKNIIANKLVLLDCVFNSNMLIDTCDINRVTFKNCQFKKTLIIERSKFKNLDLIDCIFENGFQVTNCRSHSLLMLNSYHTHDSSNTIEDSQIKYVLEQFT